KIDLSSANVTAVAAAVGGARTTFAVDSPTTVAGSLSFTNGLTAVVDPINHSDVTFPPLAGTINVGDYKTVSALAEAMNADVSSTPTAASGHFGDRFSASVDANNKLVVTS
ncbi:MAG: hypothetical protein QOC94_817, partial [Actinoplanes sp.]|nr:hypothetical protein [Actinoplanes sp.]